MAQRSIEILIGKLITDEAFRKVFLSNRSLALEIFAESGHELTPLETAALLGTPANFWKEVAEQIDPRLQKADLTKERVS